MQEKMWLFTYLNKCKSRLISDFTSLLIYLVHKLIQICIIIKLELIPLGNNQILFWNKQWSEIVIGKYIHITEPLLKFCHIKDFSKFETIYNGRDF